MNKVFILSTDNRSFQDLINVVSELKRRNIPYFFLYNTTDEKNYPRNIIEKYAYDTNFPSQDDQLFLNTLGFSLPFKPDIFLMTNENWEPEKSIMFELKQHGCFICCLENSSWIHNNIKTKLELESRKRFPSNCIDLFFDHSDWCLQTKSAAGWYDVKSIVTGNPKNDSINLETSEENIIIVYGSKEEQLHNKILKIYTEVSSIFEDHQVYYKPHPDEFKEFKLELDDTRIIYDNDMFLNLLSKSKYNISIFTSILYLPLVLNKNIVYITQDDSGISDESILDNFKGREFDFWKNVLGFKNFDSFCSFIGDEFIKQTIDRNKKLEDSILKSLLVYTPDMKWFGQRSNNLDLLKYYDNFNDGNASKRITDVLENL